MRLIKSALLHRYPSNLSIPSESLALTNGQTLFFRNLKGSGKHALVHEVVKYGNSTTPLTAKFARTKAGILAIQKEWEFYQKLSNNPRPHFIIPILEAPLSKDRGLVLIKPLLHGTPLEDYASKRIPLTEEQKASLQEIREWSDNYFLPTFKKPLDLNPTNLMWIDNPIDMTNLGLTKPSFVLFEVGTTSKSDRFLYDWVFYKWIFKP